MKSSDCFLDIETVKISVEPPFTNRGRPITKRWQVCAIGVALRSHAPTIIVDEHSEETAFMILETWLEVRKVRRIFYGATRKFDEMVLRGQFINARREFLPEPGPWPHMDHPDNYEWVNIGGGHPNPDGLSPLIATGKVPIKDVIRHCRQDVIALRKQVRELKIA
jgi:hypothetical protein